jgi:hemerythrin superfamily protein
MPTTTETIAKAAGKMKQAGAALSGEAGILNTLAGEHEEVSQLMTSLLAVEPEDTIEQRTQLFPVIRENLLAHARAEQEALYATLRSFPSAEDLIQSSIVEHGEIDSLLAELDTIGMTASTWQVTFARLVEVVQHHVAEEESVLFPRALELLSTDRLRELDSDYKLLKQQHKAEIADELE